MGSCWSTTLPEEEDSGVTTSQSLVNKKIVKKVVEFGKEEVRLNELLASLRTGLVFAPSEFSVLPGGLSTTAQVAFEVGNSELQRRQEAAYADEEESKTLNEPVEGEESVHPSSPFKLKVTLEGHGWTKNLVMTLSVKPVIGQFASRQIRFHWRDNVLEIVGCKRGELEAHSLPIFFEDEIEFCSLCLQLTYQMKKASHEDKDQDMENDTSLADDDNKISSLKYSSYRVAVANLDAVGILDNIPAKLYHFLFGSQDPVNISLTVWPKSYSVDATLSLKVKSGILFAELMYLIKEHLHCKADQVIKLYNNFRPVNPNEIVSEKVTHLDCFVNDNLSDLNSCNSFNEDVSNEVAEIVMSLVGERIQSTKVDLGMTMEEFDFLVRKEFSLKDDSFLVIISEDDFAPQYMADDNWKCTYTFSIPDNSFGAGLRRSFRRLSTRRRSDGSTLVTDTNASTFTPLMAEVIELLSSNKRRFPRNIKKCGLSIEELYQLMPLYQMSIEQCGIHPYSMVQIFEVTGPSIPITVRLVSDYSKDDAMQCASAAPRSRLANIMDINPDWSVSTLFQYIDAVVSLSSTSRQKRLTLKDNSVDDKNDLSSLVLGSLLDSWKPLWWAEKGYSRKKLTKKDIDPSEYLVIEKL